MAYEYNPQSARFDVPNPHRVENVFVAVCSTVLFVAALVLLTDSRAFYLEHAFVRFGKSLVSAVSLLTLAVTYAFLLMRQTRFFFGRGQPADLVPGLRADEHGYRAADGTDRQIPDAAVLRQTLQQNAISYRVPRGPIDNVLYSLVRDLVYSPRLTQARVQTQFRNLLGLALLLILFPISLIGIDNRAAVGWIGCVYFVLTNILVLRPLATGRLATARLSERGVIGFITAAIVAPVILASLVPPDGYPIRGVFEVVPVTFVVIVAALVVTGLVFAAGIATTIKPSQIAIAPYLETPDVNTTPAQIYTALARELQNVWQEQVPNRAYMRILPDVTERQGTFSANVIEETQPLPLDTQPMTFAHAFAAPTTRWLVVVDVVCTLFTIAGAVFVAWGAMTATAYTLVVTGAALIVVGLFGIRSANEFWRRFAFTSRIYWIDWSGNYSRSTTRIGAVLSDRVHSEREIISVESMTLRAWVADIDSVAFNTDRDRDLVAIRGLPVEAERIGRLLADFARDQGTITAPTSAKDRERLEAINALNASARGPGTPNELAAATLSALGQGNPDPVGSVAPFCTTCGKQAPSDDARFCGSCGTAINSGRR